MVVERDRDGLPTTPEGWVRDAEEMWRLHRLGGLHGELGADYDADYQNWFLWIEYQSRSRPRGDFTARNALWTARYVPACAVSGRVDIEKLAGLTRWSAPTVRKHLLLLEAVGADFARLKAWPHPLDG
jgi:hypothetical protein